MSQALAAAEKQLKFRSIGRDVVLRVQVEYRKGQAILLEARNTQNIAERRLSLLILDTDFSILSLTERMDFSRLPKPIEREKAPVAEGIFEMSPTMQWLHSNEGIIDAQKNVDLSVERPQLSVIASYGVNQDAPSYAVNYVYQAGFNMGFQLTLPLFSGFSFSARQKIYSERRFQLDQDLAFERTNFSFDVRRRMSTLSQDWNDLLMIRREIKASEEVYKDVDRTYHYGLASPDLWFQARAGLESWNLREIQKLHDYWIGYRKLADLLKLQ